MAAKPTQGGNDDRPGRSRTQRLTGEDIPKDSTWGLWVTTSEPYPLDGLRYVDVICSPGSCDVVTAVRASALFTGATKSCGNHSIKRGHAPRVPLPLAEIKRLYLEENLSSREIGEKYGVSDGTILNRLAEARIPRRDRGWVSGSRHYNWRGEDSKESKMAWLIAEKSEPCFDCGSKFPWQVMQFDHVPEKGIKLFEVNTKAACSKRSLNVIKAERIKCDLLCPTCHSIRTLARQQCSA